MYIIGAYSKYDHFGSYKHINSIEQLASSKELPIITQHIAPLDAGWGKPLPENMFQGGYAALKIAKDLENEIQDGAILKISGKDLLKSNISSEERQKLFTIYSDNRSILDGYYQVAQSYIAKKGFSKEEFLELAEALFENYWQSWLNHYPDAKRPGEKWFHYINDLFRGVDCANPVIDFEGSILIASKEISDLLEISAKDRIKICGIGVAQNGHDGPEWADDIIKYSHIKKAISEAEASAAINFKEKFFNDQAYLQLYTCYPLAPIAFLLESGMTSDIQQAIDFVKTYPVTFTGGLNLARAPVNNTTLRDLITLYEKRFEHTGIWGVHSVCALGHIQAFAILENNLRE